MIARFDRDSEAAQFEDRRHNSDCIYN